MRYFSGILLLVLLGCSKEKQPEPISARQTVIQGVGEAVIIRSFLDLQNSVNSLDEYINSYTYDSTSTQKLLKLRGEWASTVVSWKLCSIFLQGKFGSDIKSSKLYVPANTTVVEEIISQHVSPFNLAFAQTLDETSTGLGAVEYLIFGADHRDAESVISAFTAIDSRRGAYLRALASDLKQKSDHIMYQWSIAGDGYIKNFMAATGPEPSSSVGVLVDNMISTISRIKNERIGAPLGANGTVHPELVEAKFSGESILFIRAELQSIQQIFSGFRTTSISVKGFDWLLNQSNAKLGDEMLSEVIQTQFTDIYSKLNFITIPLEDAVVTNPNQVIAVNNSIEKLQKLIENDLVGSLDFKK